MRMNQYSILWNLLKKEDQLIEPFLISEKIAPNESHVGLRKAWIYCFCIALTNVLFYQADISALYSQRNNLEATFHYNIHTLSYHLLTTNPTGGHRSWGNKQMIIIQMIHRSWLLSITNKIEGAQSLFSATGSLQSNCNKVRESA